MLAHVVAMFLACVMTVFLARVMAMFLALVVPVFLAGHGTELGGTHAVGPSEGQVLASGVAAVLLAYDKAVQPAGVIVSSLAYVAVV